MSNSTYSGNVNTLFSTSIEDYTMDELLSLLGIELSSMDNYVELRDKINTEVDKNIGLFTKLNNNNMVIFFEKIRVSLIGDDSLQTISNATTSEKTVIQSNISYQLNYRTEIDKLIVFDSLFRDNYSTTMSTNYLSHLPETVKNVTKIKLHCVELPSSYYTFVDSYENNYFWMKYGTTSSDISYAYFYIQPGHYDSIILIQQFQDFVDSQSIDISFSFNLSIYSANFTLNGDNILTISTSTYSFLEINFNAPKLTNTIDSSYNISHVVEDTTIQSYYDNTSLIAAKQRLGWLLGFRNLLYTSSTSYTADAVVDLFSPKYAYLVLDDFNHSTNNTYFSASTSNSINKYTIARVPLVDTQFTYHADRSMSTYTIPRYYHGPVDMDKFQVQLLDEHQRIIDLNGNDFSFTIEVTYIYVQNNAQIS